MKNRRQANDPIKKVVNVSGLKVAVEWPKGSVRRYEDSGYERKMLADYGYIRGTDGADGEELDVYLGDDLSSQKVFVIAQLVGPYEIEENGAEPGSFDEYKVVMGVDSLGAAEGLYKLHMPAEQMGDIWEMSMKEFKNLILPIIGNVPDALPENQAPKSASIRVKAQQKLDEDDIAILGDMLMSYGFGRTPIPRSFALLDKDGRISLMAMLENGPSVRLTKFKLGPQKGTGSNIEWQKAFTLPELQQQLPKMLKSAGIRLRANWRMDELEYTLHTRVITPESAAEGEYESRDIEDEGTASLWEIANMLDNLSSPEYHEYGSGFISWTEQEPSTDRDYFESGIEKYQELSIRRPDGQPFSERQLEVLRNLGSYQSAQDVPDPDVETPQDYFKGMTKLRKIKPEDVEQEDDQVMLDQMLESGELGVTDSGTYQAVDPDELKTASVRVRADIIGRNPVKDFMPHLEDEDQHWPQESGSDFALKHSKVMEVPTDQIIASQDMVIDSNFANALKGLAAGKLPFLVQQPNGKFMVADGHHRVVSQMQNGAKSVRARVYQGKTVQDPFASPQTREAQNRQAHLEPIKRFARLIEKMGADLDTLKLPRMVVYFDPRDEIEASEMQTKYGIEPEVAYEFAHHDFKGARVVLAPIEGGESVTVPENVVEDSFYIDRLSASEAKPKKTPQEREYGRWQRPEWKPVERTPEEWEKLREKWRNVTYENPEAEEGKEETTMSLLPPPPAMPKEDNGKAASSRAAVRNQTMSIRIRARDLELTELSRTVVRARDVIASNLLPGGLSDNVPDSDFDPKKVQEGMKVELEHVSNPDMAKEIARDHLVEDENYYEKLKKVEGASVLPALGLATTLMSSPTPAMEGPEVGPLAGEPAPIQRVEKRSPAEQRAESRASKLQDVVREIAMKTGIDPALLDAVIWTESKYKTRAESPVGAQGLMQMMPITQKEMGLKDPFNAARSIDAGARYLARLLKRFKRVDLALAAYNAGPGNVIKHDGIPPFEETQNYVKAVLSRMQNSPLRKQSSRIAALKRSARHLAYDWHEPDGFELDADEHPHLKTEGPESSGSKNEQFGTQKNVYRDIAQQYGELKPGVPSDLKFYDYRPYEQGMDKMLKDEGYDVYYAGGQYGKPDLENRNYNTGHLMVYDPTPESGGDFGEEDYTRSWRKIHELSHAMTYPELNEEFGEGRRIGKLGKHRTLREAKRAVKWEWLAAHKQRELGEKLGHRISDEEFNQELNTVLHDAIHRAITGKFSAPDAEGFHPSKEKVPLETALSILEKAARDMGLKGENDLLPKTSKQPKAAGIRVSASDAKGIVRTFEKLQVGDRFLAASMPGEVYIKQGERYATTDAGVVQGFLPYSRVVLEGSRAAPMSLAASASRRTSIVIRADGSNPSDAPNGDEELEPPLPVLEEGTPWNLREEDGYLVDKLTGKRYRKKRKSPLPLPESPDLESATKRKEWEEKLFPLLPEKDQERWKELLRNRYSGEGQLPKDLYKPDRPIPEPPGRKLGEDVKVEEDGKLQNIINVLKAATPDEVAYWKDWYRYAMEDVQALAEKYDVPIPVVTAIVAVLSPNVKWESNIHAAEQILRGQGKKVIDYRKKLSDASADNFAAKLFPDLYVDREALGTFAYLQNIMKAQNVLDSWNEYGAFDGREGDEIRIDWSGKEPPTKRRSTDETIYASPDMAKRVLLDHMKRGYSVFGTKPGPKKSWAKHDGISIEDVVEGDLPESGRAIVVPAVSGPKVTAFYQSILNPEAAQGEVVLDGHAQNIWYGIPQPLHDMETTTPPADIRSEMLNDYNKASRLSEQLVGTHLTPQQVQAVTWSVWRDAIEGEERKKKKTKKAPKKKAPKKKVPKKKKGGIPARGEWSRFSRTSRSAVFG